MGMREEYLKMLDDAYESLKGIIKFSGERFNPPEPIIKVEGKQTHIVNFKELSSALNRDPKIFARFLSKEVGSPYTLTLDGSKLIFTTPVKPSLVKSRIDKFIEIYVICPICHRPDTKIVKSGKIMILKCLACGAESPVKRI
ncbi:MAG: translation initiation factor IF-2 subunit beta [Candidatus Methanodesulfokora sp.]|jgi:translation initiation factor 2 subunit 2|nr:MAG: translation initiation factor IF-2 subunit beta [Candidatus Korarchaeota archaeon]